ncbi:MAG: Hsp20 family protein [Candidatus Heimdallarchaeaceae archaeon]
MIWRKKDKDKMGFEEFRSVRVYSNINGKEKRFGYEYHRKPDGSEEYREIGKIPEEFGKDFVERMSSFERMLRSQFTFDPFKSLMSMSEIFPALEDFIDEPIRPQLAPINASNETNTHNDSVDYELQLNKENNTLIGIIEVPGFERKDIKLRYRNNNLHITGKNKRRELDITIPLDHKIDPDTIEATLKNGILEVTMKIIAENDDDEKEIPIS